MKRPLAVIGLILALAFPAYAVPGHGGSHPGSHVTHAPKSPSHHSSHHPKTTIPHTRRHVTAEEKTQLFDHAGIPKSERHNYVVDHRVPLELGGSNALSNLQVQPKGVAKRKDKVENYLAKKVRRGELSLPEAQAEIQHWETVDTSG